MNLDDLSQYKQYDLQDMLSHITTLPTQLTRGWQDASAQIAKYPVFPGITSVLITGMGGSAIAGDLVAATVEAECPAPILVLRDYQLPAWANEHTLVIASSHSGNTEETLSICSQVLKKNIPLVRITTGGKIAQIAEKSVSPCLVFEHKGQPRSAVGFSFVYMMAVLHHQGLIADPVEAIANAAAAMQSQQALIEPNVPVNQNPAKRLAGQMVGRCVTLIGSGVLGTISRRWKGQINELAKVWTGYDVLPEACHNTIAGTEFPTDPIGSNFVLFLDSNLDHPRNVRRSELLRNHLMLQGFMTDRVEYNAKNTLTLLWTSLIYGDYVAYYLAMCYEVDPTPIEAIQGFKKDLGDFDQI